MNKHFRLKPLAAAIILSTAGAGALSLIPVQAASDATEHPGFAPVSTSSSVLVERYAADAMVHVARARAALHRKDLAQAKKEVQAATRLIDIVEASLPTYKLHRQIEVAKHHLSFMAPKEVVGDLVPIRREVDVLTDVMPVHLTDQYYAHIDQIQGDMRRAEREHALNLLVELDEAVVYSEVEVPVRSTRESIAKAMAALDKQQSTAADEALKAAEQHLQVVSIGQIARPAYSASDALHRAEKHYGQGKHAEAKAEVNNAIKWLESLTSKGSEASKKYANELLTEAKSLLKHLDSKDANAAHHIRHVATRARALAEREHKLSHMAHHPSPLTVSLINAEFHLTRAQADAELGRAANEMDKGKATGEQELAQAKTYLEKAEAESPIGEKPAMKNALDEVKQLAVSPMAETSAKKFGMLKRRLTHLIRTSA